MYTFLRDNSHLKMRIFQFRLEVILIGQEENITLIVAVGRTQD